MSNTKKDIEEFKKIVTKGKWKKVIKAFDELNAKSSK